MEPVICWPQCFTRKATLSLSSVLLCIAFAWGQQRYALEVPPNFRLDVETAARLRPRLVGQSEPPTGPYAIGALVFERLVRQVVPPPSIKFFWQLRIVDDDQLNAYASPDGTVYVESRLARLAGPSAGLWAAILSHEIAHVVRRDWARRYLYQQALERNGSVTIVMGDPGMPSVSWADSEKASGNIGQFCRQMEIEADRDGLILMARAGYHPDFVPALHHLLHAQGSGVAPASLYALHPCWEERDHELKQAYVTASIDFERRWPAWYASPGGNPPVVVFAEEPAVRKLGVRGWEIQIPMRCQNLAGAVEIVLRISSMREQLRPVNSLPGPQESSNGELRQLTGCTSPRTTVTFNLDEASVHHSSGERWADVYVVDAWGAVLARADLPKLPH